MKLFKYSIFLLILFGIFVVVYRNCNKKGFRRLFVSIKLAIIITAILSGLIGENAEAVEHYGTTINPSIERPLKISGGDQSKFGPGARAKATVRRNAKSSGSFLIPGADGFVPSRNYRPYQKPLSGRRPGRIKKGIFNPDDQGGFKSAPSEGQFKKAIVYRIKENPALVREAEIMGKNQKTQIEANHLINQLSLSNRNPGTGSKSLKGCRNVSYLRGDKGARIFYRETKEGIEILCKANKKNEQKVIDILRTMYN